MPSVRRFELKEGSIETTLARSKYNLLPKAILDEPLTGWILEFDRTEREEPVRDRRVSDDPVLTMLVKELSERVFQPTLTFYHAALMHIGPQWAVAEEGLQRAKALLETDNLEQSARDIESKYLELGLEQGGAREIVERFACNVAEVWHERMRLISTAWEVWRDEVDKLKTAMRKADEGLSDPYERRPFDIFDLLELCSRRSELSSYGFPDRREMALGTAICLVALTELIALSHRRSCGTAKAEPRKAATKKTERRRVTAKRAAPRKATAKKVTDKRSPLSKASTKKASVKKAVTQKVGVKKTQAKNAAKKLASKKAAVKLAKSKKSVARSRARKAAPRHA